MICPKCGSEMKEVTEGGFSCPNCSNKEKKKISRGAIIGVAIIFIIVLLTIVGVAIGLNLRKNHKVDSNSQEENNFSSIIDRNIQKENTETNTNENNILTNQALASKAKPGDYVEYDGGNGYTGLWQVLYNDSTYGIQIISADTVTDSFILGSNDEKDKAKLDYNNSVKILNDECRKYVNTEYAISGRCVGSNPLNPDDQDNMETVKFPFQFNGSKESGCKIEDENYKIDCKAMTTATSQNKNGVATLNKRFWLASRDTSFKVRSAEFSVRKTTGFDTGAGVGRELLMSFYDNNQLDTDERYSGLRPVITLKYNIETSEGDGSEIAPFKLLAGANTPSYQTLASKAKPGDYVEYDGGNYYSGLWQVLYNDSTYGLQIISSDIVNTVILGGMIDEAKSILDYNDAVQILNDECRKYINPVYATSGRCVGSNPLNPNDLDNMNTVSLQFEYYGSVESGLKIADENYKNDYNAMKKANSQNTKGICSASKEYWLASRQVDSKPDSATFYIRNVDTDGDIKASRLWEVYSNLNSFPSNYSYGIRPVINLKLETHIVSGDGSIQRPFKLTSF